MAPHEPPVDVFFQGDEWIIRTALPGVKPEDISLRVWPASDDRLSVRISGKRALEHSGEGVQFRQNELPGWTEFSRQILMPWVVRHSHPVWTLERGILEVRFRVRKYDEPSHQCP